jgi:uncharacterized SAM-binding protein YcdF (DUF218 family)
LHIVLKAVLALILPSTLLALCCIAGTGLIVSGRRLPRRIGTLLLGFGVLALTAILLLPVDTWLLRPLEDRFPPPTLTHVDGIVVLCGAISADVSADRAIPTLNRDADRLVAFATLARAYPTARLIFAGGSAPDGLTEAQATRSLLDRLGVAPGRVQYDDQSQTTWQNAVNALKLAHPAPNETWVLITSASHMPRAMGAFRGAGWPPLLAWPVAYRTTKNTPPAMLRPIATKLAAIDLAAHEWVGLVEYRLSGRTNRLLP